ncbi:MAG: pilus assembly protein [Actinobacteria bacterium]|nr:pilus assembly protein [Actinomycetota bacterium]
MLRLTPRRGRRGDRGASAVEFAILVPVLLLILLGILEFAFVLRDYLSVSSAVRVGTRVAASGAGSKAATCPNPLPTGMTACAGTDTPQLAQSAADAIQRAGTAMAQDAIDEIWVYRANTSGYPANSYYTSVANPNNTTGATTQAAMLAAGCNTACVKYAWNDAQNKFEYRGGVWDYTKINACIKDPDAVGIYMKATHPFFTKFIRSTISMTDRSVMSFEPLPAGQCAPGAHN